MGDFENFDETEYKRSVLEEIRHEIEVTRQPSLSGLEVREFMSRSNGRGRKPRRHPREVSLLVYNKTAYQIISGEIGRRARGGLSIDIVASEALAFLPAEDRSVDRLIAYARKSSKLGE